MKRTPAIKGFTLGKCWWSSPSFIPDGHAPTRGIEDEGAARHALPGQFQTVGPAVQMVWTRTAPSGATNPSRKFFATPAHAMAIPTNVHRYSGLEGVRVGPVGRMDSIAMAAAMFMSLRCERRINRWELEMGPAEISGVRNLKSFARPK